MDDWGRDPDVALFVGGPKHCEIENIGNLRTVRIQDTEDIWSFQSAYPLRVAVAQYEYVRELVVLPNGNRATVMRDQTVDRVRAAQIAQSEWAFISNWRSVWGTPVLPAYRWLAEPQKTPEEALAWLHNGTGKDFL